MGEGTKKSTNKGLINQIIPGTTLKVVREYTVESKTGRSIQKVTCKCVVCGKFPESNREVEYDFSKLKSEQSMCKVCVQRITDSRRTDAGRTQNFNKEFATLYYHEQEILNGVLNPGLKTGREYVNTQPNARQFFKGIPAVLEIGNVITKRDTDGRILFKYKVIGYKGVYIEGRRQGEPTLVIFKCSFCYGLHVEEISNFMNKNYKPQTCTDCKNKKLVSRNSVYKNGLDKLKPSIPSKDISANYEEGVSEFISDSGVNKDKENAAKFADALRKVNKNCYTHGYVKNNGLVCKIICSICGYSRGEYIYDSNRKDWNLGECKGCAIKAQDPLYRGKYKLDYVGKVFNGLEITKQYNSTDGFLCDVRCICKGKSKEGKCGINRFGLPLHDVINKQIFCECRQLLVYVECRGKIKRHGELELCDNLIPVMLKDIDKSGFVTCKICRNHKVTKEDFEKKVAFKDAEDSFMLMDERLKKEMGVGETTFDVENNLIVSKNELYIGVSSSRGYKRAACLSDNTHLTLTQEEIDEFECANHCNNVQQRMLPDIFSTQVQSQIKL